MEHTYVYTYTFMHVQMKIWRFFEGRSEARIWGLLGALAWGKRCLEVLARGRGLLECKAQCLKCLRAEAKDLETATKTSFNLKSCAPESQASRNLRFQTPSTQGLPPKPRKPRNPQTAKPIPKPKEGIHLEVAGPMSTLGLLATVGCKGG